MTVKLFRKVCRRLCACRYATLDRAARTLRLRDHLRRILAGRRGEQRRGKNIRSYPERNCSDFISVITALRASHLVRSGLCLTGLCKVVLWFFSDRSEVQRSHEYSAPIRVEADAQFETWRGSIETPLSLFRLRAGSQLSDYLPRCLLQVVDLGPSL